MQNLGPHIFLRLEKWILFLILFLIPPIMVYVTGNNSLITVDRNNQNVLIEKRLSRRLDQIKSHVNPENAWCSILKSTLKKAEKTGNAGLFCQKAMQRLSQVFGTPFPFFHRGSGKNTFHLSPRLPKIDQWLRFGNICQEVFVEEIVKRRKANTQKYQQFLSETFGSFFQSILLVYPLKSTPRLIPYGSDPERRYLWYGCENGQFLSVILHRDLLEGTLFMQKSMKAKNVKTISQTKSFLPIILGFSESPEFKNISTPGFPINQKEILKTLKAFEITGNPFHETTTYFVLIRSTDSALRIFAVIPKSLFQQAWNPIPMFSHALFAFTMLLSGGIAFRAMVLCHRLWVSIRLKILLLFFFASGVPLSILGTLAILHLSQKWQVSLQASAFFARNLLKNHDEHFLMHFVSLEKRLESIEKKLLSVPFDRPAGEKLRRRLQRAFKKILISNFFFIQNDFSRTISRDGIVTGPPSMKGFSYNDSSKTEQRFAEARLIQVIAKKVLNGLNNNDKPDKKLEEIEMVFESYFNKPITDLLNSVVRSIGHIQAWGFSGMIKLEYYIQVFHDYAKKKYSALLMVFWAREDMQTSYLENSILRLNRNPLGMTVFAHRVNQSEIVKEPGKVIPRDLAISNSLRRFLYSTDMKDEIAPEIVLQNKQSFLAIAYRPKYLPDNLLVGLIPLKPIKQNISNLRRIIFLFSLISLILTLGIAYMLSSSFIEPVKTLSKAVSAIEKRHFDHRIDLQINDEFGNIARTLDQTLESLGDLQIARVVQENLFPLSFPSLGAFRFFGRSISMGELGGDYYDFFPLKDSFFGVLMGDVAGHGVPAALVMAMAKAEVLYSEAERATPVALLAQLNQLIFTTKNKKRPALMTLQYLKANQDTGQIYISNAGQCFPVLINPKQGKSSLIRLPSAPLGFLPKTVYKEHLLTLEPGNALILYTDGWVEVENPARETAGYDLFQRWLLQCYDPVPEIYYQRLYETMLQYRNNPEAQDDLTIFILVYQPKCSFSVS